MELNEVKEICSNEIKNILKDKKSEKLYETLIYYKIVKSFNEILLEVILNDKNIYQENTKSVNCVELHRRVNILFSIFNSEFFKKDFTQKLLRCIFYENKEKHLKITLETHKLFFKKINIMGSQFKFKLQKNNKYCIFFRDKFECCVKREINYYIKNLDDNNLIKECKCIILLKEYILQGILKCVDRIINLSLKCDTPKERYKEKYSSFYIFYTIIINNNLRYMLTYIPLKMIILGILFNLSSDKYTGEEGSKLTQLLMLLI